MSSSRQLATRPAAHAGSFYAADPGRLRAQVDGLLDAARERLPDLDPAAIVGALVPHAGLDYSGAIAGLGWAAIAATRPRTIVIVGTDHGGRAGGVGVWTQGGWESPLGLVSTDELLAERLAGLGDPFRAAPRAHLDEHSIEVQLPFIAVALPDVFLVPLLVDPRLSAGACAVAGAMLGQALRSVAAGGRRVVLVASSDFAHYPTDAVARAATSTLLEPILALDPVALSVEERAVATSGEAGLVCGMCGLQATCVSLAALAAGGAIAGVLLGTATSADVPRGDAVRTVGYAAVAFLRALRREIEADTSRLA